MSLFNKNMFSSFAFWAVCSIFIILANIDHLWRPYSQKIFAPYCHIPGPGQVFAEFKPLMNNTSEAGFLTDKDMSPENNDGVFLQAQYALAPVLLHLNDPQQDWLIIDPSHILSAMDLTQSLTVDFIKITPENKILAKQK